MHDLMEEYIKDGLAGLGQLLVGKHLRPAQLACTIVSIVAAPEAAQSVVLQGYLPEPVSEENNGEAS